MILLAAYRNKEAYYGAIRMGKVVISILRPSYIKHRSELLYFFRDTDNSDWIARVGLLCIARSKV